MKKSAKQETPKAKKAPRSKWISEPTDAQVRAALAMWKKGEDSIWGIKHKTMIKAKVLQTAFEKILGKKLGSPAARFEVKGKKSSAKEEKTLRRAA